MCPLGLLSYLGKLFNACLNARISKFMYENEIIGFEQAGFLPESSIMNHFFFTLHSIIEYYKGKKGRVYCTFIDYSKSFDLTDRASLWIKLLKHDVNVKILPVMQYIYIYIYILSKKRNAHVIQQEFFQVWSLYDWDNDIWLKSAICQKSKFVC